LERTRLIARQLQTHRTRVERRKETITMNRRNFVASSAAGGAATLTATNRMLAQTTPAASPAASPVASPRVQESGYAPVNDLEMYYEIYGQGAPLLFLHGGLTNIDWAASLMSVLAASRQVIAVEQQGHGRTQDIDRPITYDNMASDTAGFIEFLGQGPVDVVGYSMGGTTALGLAIARPELIRKLVTISSPYENELGFRIENLEGSRSMTPEALAGSPLEAAQLAVTEHPEQWPAVVEKVAEMNRTWRGWAPMDIRAIAAPTLNIVGDADGIRIDHTLEMLRLRGGDVNGDFAGIPDSQMAVLPGASHFSIIARVDLLGLLILPYLAA
jgi:pimeloyl-ACP methyl ester carboxylesterase